MKMNFCTLFNSAFLSRGLALYHSLEKCSPDFHLYVFAFDDDCYHYLKACAFKNMTVVSLKEFEGPELLRVKPTRTRAEYCWTCASSTIWYSIQQYGLDHCTYIDADMYFYSDPQVLVDEMGDASVLITEHRYSKAYEQSATAGKYCVQFVTFKNDKNGMEALKWWKDVCIEWCYARHEDGKFGDQKYLDDWTTRFKGVHVLQHLGGGVAPWNVQQYQVQGTRNEVRCTMKNTGEKFQPVFYHFHSLRFYDEGIVSLSDEGYDISNEVIDLFYRPYVNELVKAGEEVRSSGAAFDPHATSGPSPFGDSEIANVFRHYMAAIKSSKRNILGKGLAERLRHRYFFKIKDLLS